MKLNSPFTMPLKELPESPHLGIRCLSAVFRHTTNSYKYYWLLAILEMVKNGQTLLPINQLTAEMLAQAWYPVHYFHLNFGSEDQLSHLALRLKDHHKLPVNASREEVRKAILEPAIYDVEFNRDFHKLERYVPQRLLRPWFDSELRGMRDHITDRQIQQLANESFSGNNPSLYRFVPDSLGLSLQLHPEWREYLTINFRFVRDFVLWDLVEYFRQRNPHVPNLPEKLFPPEKRDLGHARGYWNSILQQKALMCPYSGEPIPPQGFSLDHFIPWSFTCHDQLWNLVPVSKSINSAKSDCLPELERYLQPFTHLQYEALHMLMGKTGTDRKAWIEDYTNLFHCDSRSLFQLSHEHFHKVMRDTIVPLEQIAANMGFTRGWRFTDQAPMA